MKIKTEHSEKMLIIQKYMKKKNPHNSQNLVNELNRCDTTLKYRFKLFDRIHF